MKSFVHACAIGTLTIAAPSLASAACVGRVLLPPMETSHAERVLQAPGRVERFRTPPRVERIAHRVMAAPARIERVRIAAIYRMDYRTVRAPGPTRYTHLPDRFETVTQPVVTAPGHWVWERRYAPVVSGAPEPGQTVVSPTGVVMCKVWCPARVETVQRRVLVERGRLLAERTTVDHTLGRRVLVRPARVEIHRIAAQYRIVVTARMLSPGRWMERRTAAQWGWRERREVRDGGAGWAPVVCGGPLSRPAMAHMQGALNAQGYDAGPADGLQHPETYQALHRYQVEHRQAAGQVTVESARSLGVIAPQE